MKMKIGRFNKSLVLNIVMLRSRRSIIIYLTRPRIERYVF